MGEACGTHEEKKKEMHLGIMWGKLKEIRQLERPGNKWDIKIDLGETGTGGCGVGSSGSGQGVRIL
jgi:hypothetical protein